MVIESGSTPRADGPPRALVTGAARRIGAALARALHGAGYDLCLHHHRSTTDAAALTDELERARPGSVRLLQANLARTAGRDTLLAEMGNAGLDVLVHNASAYRATPIGEIDENNWRALVGSNLEAPLFLTQALRPQLARRGGVVIHLVDALLERGLAGYGPYAAAKSGLAALTRAWAVELAPEIRVNAIAPGSILWPEPPPSPEAQAAHLARIPLGRLGRVEDIAEAALYLIRARYVTGETLHVDGGLRLT